MVASHTETTTQGAALRQAAERVGQLSDFFCGAGVAAEFIVSGVMHASPHLRTCCGALCCKASVECRNAVTVGYGTEAGNFRERGDAERFSKFVDGE